MNFSKPSRSATALGRLAIGAAASLTALGCGGPRDEATATTAQALGADAGLLTISGVVADSQSPQAGITITLSGSSQAQVVTDFSGSYSFSVKPGSYSLTARGTANFFEPPFQSCLVITPDVVNLNNLTASTTVNFLGSGNNVITNCAPAEVMGSTSGSLTVSGKVTSVGAPVPGVLVSLAGGAQGTRVTDETGAYSFAVNPGSYSLRLSGPCSSFTPGNTNLNNIKSSQTANFQGTSCPPAPLTLCPTFDTLFGFSEPASCAVSTTADCAFDRVFSWDSTIANDWFNINESDCRFGQWDVPPIVNLFEIIGLEQDSSALNLFGLQLLGCALAGNLVGPLGFPLIPTDLKSLSFTTADLAALANEYVEAISQALSDNGSPPLTAAEIAAINAQLASAASRVPGIKSSSALSFSTCADAGAP
jgi:Carboxypeptidase regulatory-like domain